ncbi:MAG: 23S rRNA (guanosine(2251)-2'-O)-methyltransferase RlmB [Aminipila sp.]
METENTNNNIIVGRNPVMEALRSDREIEKLIVGKGAEGSIKKIVGMAKDKKIPITMADKAVLDRLSNGSPHQGVAAYVSSYSYCEVEDILEVAERRGESPFVMILDNLEDPHNLGAIMRTAEACGAHGIIIPKRRSVGITDVVAKASAGAVEYIPCAKVSNIAQTIDSLKEKGIWIYACDMDGDSYYKTDLKGAIAIVIGSEGFGISRLVKEKCDFVVSIPMVGKITSLNASNAAAVLMCEVRKQRDARRV